MAKTKCLISYLLVICTCSHVTQSLNVHFFLLEDMPNNTLIGSLIKETDLQSKVNESVTNLQFYFWKKEEPIISLFRINANTSQIYSAMKIDRESEKVCRYQIECDFQFDVAVRSRVTNYFETIAVKITVTDQNDNAPTFEKESIDINVSESTTSNQSILTINGARDLDTGVNNSVQFYEFISPNQDFKLQKQKTNIGTVLNIVTNTSLDRERQKSYQLFILAKDGGSPQKTGTLTVNVIILDENDNAPIFKQDSANITVKEDALPNSPIYKFSATDKDDGLNGEVIYHFQKYQNQESEILELFSIRNTTGEVTLIGKLVYKEGKNYNIIIEASDRGANPRVSYAKLQVWIQDTGNNAPKMTITFLSPEVADNVVSIVEDAVLELVVATINVEDTDTGPNGEVTCRTYSTYFGLQSINDMGYKVIVQHKLDRETKDKHNVTVTCSDKGTPSMNDHVDFVVQIADANDNAPKFSEYYYNINVDEGLSNGNVIIQVNATDNDVGENARITYSMEPITDKRFTIDNNNGKVTANIDFDREQTAHVTFQVRATDHGSPPKNTTATVVIDINDINDNAPNFVKSIFTYNVNEHAEAGQLVGSPLQAIDQDQGKNGQIIYSLPPDFNTSSVPFQVLPTGEIKTNESLDREKISRYDFHVIATDHGSPILTGSALVTIFITDKNDHEPKFLFPNPQNHTIMIPNTTPTESIIASIQAFDLDDDTNGNGNGKVMYFIIGGNEDGIFYLNHETGSLHYKKAVYMNEDKVFVLTIMARDGGVPTLESNQQLEIIIQYTNATTVSPLTDNSDKYVLILVSVICVTIVLSVGLLAVICVLRKRGDKKPKTSGLMYPASRLPVEPKMYDAPSAVSTITKDYSMTTQNSKSPSKASFSIHNKGDTFTKEQLMEKLTGSVSGRPSNPPDVIDGKYSYVHRGAPIVPALDPQNQVKHNREESLSETSGETLPSDSGHGGSVEDFNGHHDSQKYNLNPYFGKDTPGIYVIRQQSRASNSDSHNIKGQVERPPPYPSVSAKTSKYFDDSLLTSSSNSVHSENNHIRSRHNSNNVQTLPTIPGWTGFHSGERLSDSLLFYTKDGTLGSQSAHSRDDDDVTTTSGSYTINPDDLDDDFSMRPRDLFV